jgi:hypothetical protein
MQDKKDPGTVDWVEQEASALKSKTGELQLPINPENFLKCIALHCVAEGRDHVELIQDIHDATCYWLHDRDIREVVGNTTAHDYTRGLN